MNAFQRMSGEIGDQARSSHWKGFCAENPIFSTQLKKKQQQQTDKRKDHDRLVTCCEETT